jgi:DNA-binding XRE family transcriptional regulator
MDDMEKYLTKRKNKDIEFNKIWEEEQLKREIIRMIIKVRIKEGLTQKELADKLGTSQSAIARFESCRGNPSLNFLLKLGKVLNKKLELKFA